MFVLVSTAADALPMQIMNLYFQQILPLMYMNRQNRMSVWILKNNQEAQIQVVILLKTKCFSKSKFSISSVLKLGQQLKQNQ